MTETEGRGLGLRGSDGVTHGVHAFTTITNKRSNPVLVIAKRVIDSQPLVDWQNKDHHNEYA